MGNIIARSIAARETFSTLESFCINQRVTTNDIADYSGVARPSGENQHKAGTGQ